MNNEPVAWMDANDKTIISNEKKWANDIPLYANPAKTLTDEEIEECFADAGKDFEYPYAFARAILRKAQEK